MGDGLKCARAARATQVPKAPTPQGIPAPPPWRWPLSTECSPLPGDGKHPGCDRGDRWCVCQCHGPKAECLDPRCSWSLSEESADETARQAIAHALGADHATLAYGQHVTRYRQIGGTLEVTENYRGFVPVMPGWRLRPERPRVTECQTCEQLHPESSAGICRAHALRTGHIVRYAIEASGLELVVTAPKTGDQP